MNDLVEQHINRFIKDVLKPVLQQNEVLVIDIDYRLLEKHDNVEVYIDVYSGVTSDIKHILESKIFFHNFRVYTYVQKLSSKVSRYFYINKISTAVSDEREYYLKQLIS